MPLKALVAFGIICGLVLPARPDFTWGLPTNTREGYAGAGSKSIPETYKDQTFLTLKEALIRSLETHPELAALSQEIKARSFEALQTGLRPNPEFSVEVENFAGSGEFSGTESAETTVRISQLFELGDKRHKRRLVGLKERELAEHELEIARSGVIFDTTKSFVAVLAAQERLSLAEEQAAVAEKVLETVEDRIKAGKTAAIEKSRFQTLVADARLRVDAAQHKLDAARRLLSATWGSEASDFKAVRGNLENTGNLPEWTELEKRIADSPVISWKQSDLQHADQTLSLAQANRIPDLTLSLGAKNDQASGDNALVAEFEVPLPIFDRNQGGIGAARTRLTKARDLRRAAELKLRNGLIEAWRQLQSAASEIATLQTEILPATQKTFDAVTYGYQAGKYGFLEVLDAERSFFAANDRYLEALTAYHLAVAELGRLLGQEFFIEETLSGTAGNERGEQ